MNYTLMNEKDSTRALLDNMVEQVRRTNIAHKRLTHGAGEQLITTVLIPTSSMLVNLANATQCSIKRSKFQGWVFLAFNYCGVEFSARGREVD